MAKKKAPAVPLPQLLVWRELTIWNRPGGSIYQHPRGYITRVEECIPVQVEVLTLNLNTGGMRVRPLPGELLGGTWDHPIAPFMEAYSITPNKAT